jgi:hypothetical protein
MESERSGYSPEKERTTRAVRRLRSALNVPDRDYIDSRLAVQEFIEAEFAVDAAYSDSYIARLENERILPADGAFDTDADRALEWYRQGVYSYWIPLYRETHTSDEFQAWLPDALEVVFPANGRHSRTICDLGVRDPEELPLYGLACPTSSCCPVKVATNDVLLNTPFMPYDDDGMMLYERQASDPIRLCADAYTLVEALHGKRVISGGQMLVAKKRYSQAYAALRT